jgi:hypothetical protein
MSAQYPVHFISMQLDEQAAHTARIQAQSFGRPSSFFPAQVDQL